MVECAVQHGYPTTPGPSSCVGGSGEFRSTVWLGNLLDGLRQADASKPCADSCSPKQWHAILSGR